MSGSHEDDASCAEMGTGQSGCEFCQASKATVRMMSVGCAGVGRGRSGVCTASLAADALPTGGRTEKLLLWGWSETWPPNLTACLQACAPTCSPLLPLAPNGLPPRKGDPGKDAKQNGNAGTPKALNG